MLGSTGMKDGTILYHNGYGGCGTLSYYQWCNKLLST
jgi:hypothetical protein